MRIFEIVFNIFGAIALIDYFWEGEEISIIWSSLFFLSAVVFNLVRDVAKLKERKGADE